MFKRYYLKWYLIVTGVLICATTLSFSVREGLNHVQWNEYPMYIFLLAVTLFQCWLVHGFFIIHRVKGLNSWCSQVISITVATFTNFLVGFLIHAIFSKSEFNNEGVSFYNWSGILIHFIGAFLVSVATFVVFYNIHTSIALHKSRLQNEILKQANLRAQLMALQQQISPHFLYNSLSTLKTLTQEKPTKDFIMQLAAVYRYVLNCNQHSLTPLREELNFIHSYLYIIKARFEDSVIVEINVGEPMLKLMVPPLVIQLLVENAVKHNIILPERPLRISITTEDSKSLIVSNGLQLKHSAEDGSGTGITNIRERYRLLTGTSVFIEKCNKTFKVILPLLNP